MGKRLTSFKFSVDSLMFFSGNKIGAAGIVNLNQLFLSGIRLQALLLSSCHFEDEEAILLFDFMKDWSVGHVDLEGERPHLRNKQTSNPASICVVVNECRE